MLCPSAALCFGSGEKQGREKVGNDRADPHVIRSGEATAAAVDHGATRASDSWAWRAGPRLWPKRG